MENVKAKDAQRLPYSYGVKVHRTMCFELSKYVDRISKIFPAIESAQPRCASGIEALCSLNVAMEKASLIIQHCAECSKLYLAITGNTVFLRCERVRKALEQSLCNIQNMVPMLLAAKISRIVVDLRDAKFVMESSDEVAGKVVLSLIRQESNSSEASEFEAFQTAALKLHLTSPKALLIEKRSIRKLLDKVRNIDQTKERILEYLLYLLRKYGSLIKVEQTGSDNVQYEDSCSRTNSIPLLSDSVCDESVEPELGEQLRQNEDQTDGASEVTPPEEFRCPISGRLMYDPVVIASGQTFERMWIEKWFSEGHDLCPKTEKQLPHFSIVPNSAMKDLISKWCIKHEISIQNPCSDPIPEALLSWNSSSSCSITSLGGSFSDVQMPTPTDLSCVSIGSSDVSWVSDLPRSKIVDSVSLGSAQASDDSHTYQSSAAISNAMHSDSLFEKFTALPWELLCKAMGDVKNQLMENNEACHSMLNDNFGELLIQFLKEACELCDVEAQRDGAQVFLAFMRRSGTGIPSLSEDLFHVLASVVDSEIAEEALAIMEVLSADEYCNSKIVASGALPTILQILDSDMAEYYAPTVRILHNLSLYGDIRFHILQTTCLSKVISFLSDSSLAEHCLKILNYLCETEEGRIAVAEAKGCITSIAELLEIGTHEQQEQALSVLLSLCSHHFKNSQLVLKEGVIPSLVNISINGNSHGKETAMKLLQLFRDILHNDTMEKTAPLSTGAPPEYQAGSSTCSAEKRSPSKTPGYFGRKIMRFRKPKSVALD
ncbi:U-box domain-containing protein 5-like [Papaver somniferum]|uniref:U-box domain-containing protein 5-like n=1 Tax=Papaver somniferum TaxID=3469 RepID=UPI000E70043B|nr:U-box domain-containing protein 5-like [Papaver somniferum]